MTDEERLGWQAAILGIAEMLRRGGDHYLASTLDEVAIDLAPLDYTGAPGGVAPLITRLPDEISTDGPLEILLIAFFGRHAFSAFVRDKHRNALQFDLWPCCRCGKTLYDCAGTGDDLYVEGQNVAYWLDVDQELARPAPADALRLSVLPVWFDPETLFGERGYIDYGRGDYVHTCTACREKARLFMEKKRKARRERAGKEGRETDAKPKKP